MTFTEHVIYFKHLSYLVLYLCDLIVQQQIDFAFTSPVRQVRQTKIALTFDNDNHVFKSSLPVVPFINLNHQKYKYSFFFVNPLVSLSFDRWHLFEFSFSQNISNLYENSIVDHNEALYFMNHAVIKLCECLFFSVMPMSMPSVILVHVFIYFKTNVFDSTLYLLSSGDFFLHRIFCVNKL